MKILQTEIATRLVLVLCAGLGNSLHAQTNIANPLVDYSGFARIVERSGNERTSRLLNEPQFLAAMTDHEVIVLDARSTSMYALRHVKGAINLPFTEFTEAALAKAIPDKARKILIYCNNNFLGSPRAFATKIPAASLNLSTYTALNAYGYTNLFELGPLLDVLNTSIPFAGKELP